MNHAAAKSSDQKRSPVECAIDRYATAWRLGTGLPVAVEPGIYSITDSLRVDGVRYVTLDGRIRIDARQCRSVQRPD